MILLTLLSFYGVTFALRSSTLLEPWRLWITRRSRFARDILGCPFCVGFHAGYLVYLATAPFPWRFGDVFLYAFAGAAFSYVVETVVLWFERLVPSAPSTISVPQGDHHEVIRPPPFDGMYVDNGILKHRGPDGTITTLGKP